MLPNRFHLGQSSEELVSTGFLCSARKEKTKNTKKLLSIFSYLFDFTYKKQASILLLGSVEGSLPGN